MNPSRLVLSFLLGLVSASVSTPRALAVWDEPGLPDYIPVQGGFGGNNRWDYLYWSPSTGAMVSDWNADNWARRYGVGGILGNPWPPTRYPTEVRNEALYAVFWDSMNTGSASGFKTADLDTDIVVRGLHFRNQDWSIQDADHANTLTLISGTARPHHLPSTDDREAITMDAGSRATISAKVVLGAFFGSTWSSDGTNQYVAMGANSALTISGDISQTGAAKTLVVGRFDAPVGAGSALTLSGNNTFTGGLTLYTSGSAAYDAVTTPRLNLNHNQALGTGPLTINGGPVILSNTSGASVTIANPLAINSTTPGTTGNFYNSNVVVADVENLVFDGAHDTTLTSNLTLPAHRSIRVEDGGGALVLAGRILSDGSTTSSLFKNGPGTLVLSATDSTYTGVTQVNGGILEVSKLANAGQASSIGAGQNTVARNLAGIYGENVSTSSTTNSSAADAPVPGLILSNGGTLRYVGTGDSTDRLIGLLPGRRHPTDTVTTPVSIDASGTGALKFTNSGEVVHINNYGTLFRILNLTGTNTDDNTFNLALTDITSSAGLVRNQLTKTGTGTWILSGNNSYTGGTTVEAGKLVMTGTNTGTGEIRVNGGTLLIDGDNSGSTGAVLVAASGTLGGSGTIGGHITIASGGTISPGNSPGILTTGDQTWDGGGSYVWELDSATGDAGTNWDLLDITGTLALDSLDAGNPFTIAITSLDSTDVPGAAADFDPAQSYSWILVTASGGITGFDAGTFAIDSSGFANAPNSSRFSLSRDGNHLVLSYSAVPEPATYGVVLGIGLALLALARRRRR